MSNRHTHARSTETRSLSWVIGISATFFVLEIFGGIVGKSLALLADAAHLFTDVTAIGLALFAIWLARRAGGAANTYGNARAEILAALGNGIALILISIWLGYEAIRRLGSAPDVDGPIVFAVAIFGLAANVIGVLILRRDAHNNLNVRAAFLHLLGDAFASIAVIVSATVILLTGWNPIDPIAALVITALILFVAFRLIMATFKVLMEASPEHVPVGEVNSIMLGEDGVASVHDLHVWTLTSGCVAMSAHVVSKREADGRSLLAGLRERLKSEFDIGHLTLQVEDTVLVDEGGHFGDDPTCRA